MSETADPSCSLSEARSELTELAVVAAIEESEVHKTITDNGEETLILFHTTQVVEDTATTDIGNILKPNPLPDQFCQAMKSLSAPAKYDVLKNPQVHAPHKKFPTQYLGGCNRSFKPVWLSQHSWMVYCDKVDGVFCAPCALFSCQPSRGNFVCKPFRTWHKKSEKTKEHEKCLYHQQALKQAEDLKRSIEHPGSTINALVDARVADNIKRNRAILKSIASAVLYCGKQGIALRGDTEKFDKPGNPGNFLALLKLLAVHDKVLREHLESPTMRSAKQLSPQTQNELIAVMGQHIILQDLVKEINAA